MENRYYNGENAHYTVYTVHYDVDKRHYDVDKRHCGVNKRHKRHYKAANIASGSWTGDSRTQLDLHDWHRLLYVGTFGE